MTDAPAAPQKKPMSAWNAPLVAAGLLMIIYALPRLLVRWLGESDPWASYFYQYGFGLIFFLIGILLIRLSGACRPGRGRDRLWFRVLLGGFVFYAAGHALWIWAALRVPFLGAP